MSDDLKVGDRVKVTSAGLYHGEEFEVGSVSISNPNYYRCVHETKYHSMYISFRRGELENIEPGVKKLDYCVHKFEELVLFRFSVLACTHCGEEKAGS